MTLVVDDVLLLSALAPRPSLEIRRALDRHSLFTTGGWYYRLARAAYDRSFHGAISARLAAMPVALDAALRVTTESRLLFDACEAVGVEVEVVSV